MTITGKGRKTIVDGQDVSRVFSLLTFLSHTLKNMVIEDGNDDNGAGILAGPATARLSKVVLRSNAASVRGGALYTASTKLKISKSTLTQNSATNGGGGIYLPTGFVGSPETRAANSTISRNAGALGGGMHADGAERSGADDDPSVDLLNSTVAENLAAVSGGGVAAILGASAYPGQHDGRLQRRRLRQLRRGRRRRPLPVQRGGLRDQRHRARLERRSYRAATAPSAPVSSRAVA